MRADLELLEAWRRGDEGAGNELLKRHFRSVYMFFDSKVGDGAEDLAQQTFLACVEARDRVDPTRGSFKSYLFGIARNLLLQFFRRHRRGANVDFGTVSIEDLGGVSPSRVVAAREEHALLVDALRRLPVDAQIALELHYWEDMSASEIADVLSIPAGTARSRLHRAQQSLRAVMRQLDPNGRLGVDKLASSVKQR